MPLESIFKLINANEHIPFIKYNPGMRLENIYRLYTNGYYSSNGSKIPTLYVDFDYKKTKILNLAKELSKRKKVGYYVKYNEKEIYYEFLENGSIEVKISFEEPQTVDFINNLVFESLNDMLLNKIKHYLKQSGYNYDLFNSIYDENIKINTMDYIFNIKENKKINVNKIVKCVSSIFNINNGIMKKSDDVISLTYKRVSSFHKMNSIMTFITLSGKKKLREVEIVELLQENFRLSEKEAATYISQWQESVIVKVNINENEMAEIESNPGFEVLIKSNIMNKTMEFDQGTTVLIKDINNIHYIKFLNIYINALLLLLFYNELIDDEIFNNLCKGRAIKEIKEMKELKADKEEIKDDGKMKYEKIKVMMRRKMRWMIFFFYALRRC